MLSKELNVICSLSHPNIMVVYGMCQDLSPEKRIAAASSGLKDCVLMTEFCQRDSLYTVMSNSLIELTWRRFFRWSIQLLSAIAFLHSSQPAVVHCNVKSLNVLIDKDWNLKLGDIGKSQFFFTSHSAESTAIASSFPWFAPEVLQAVQLKVVESQSQEDEEDDDGDGDDEKTDDDDDDDSSKDEDGGKSDRSKRRSTIIKCGSTKYILDLDRVPFSTASDVYSAGIVMWELLRRTLTGTYTRPWEGEHDLPPSTEPIKLQEKVIRLQSRFHSPFLVRDDKLMAPCFHRASNTGKGEKIGVCPGPLGELYDSMTSLKPEDRPSAATIVDQLKALMHQYKKVDDLAMDWDERRRVHPGAKPIKSDRKAMRFPPTKSVIAQGQEILAAKSGASSPCHEEPKEELTEPKEVFAKPEVPKSKPEPEPAPEDWEVNDEPGTSHQHKLKSSRKSEFRSPDSPEPHRHRKHHHHN